MPRSAYLVHSLSSTTIRSLNYAPATEVFRRVGSGETIRLGDLVARMGPAYGSVFVRYDCEPEHGVELLPQADMFAAEPMGRWIRPDALPRLRDQYIRPWQILIAGAGTLGDTELYGRSLIADARLAGKIVGPDSMTLTCHEPGADLALYAYAFLCTDLGVQIVRATSFGTNILRLRKDLLAAIPIPLAGTEKIQRVADHVRTVVAERERYWQELQRARAVVEALPEMQEATAMCRERSRRCVVWDGSLPTLTAWTYGSAGEALGFLQRRWSARLGDVVDSNGIFRGPRFARVSCQPPHGIDFLSQRDVFLMRPVPRRIMRPDLDHGQLFCKRNMLLVGGQGTLGEGEVFGRVALMGPDLDHSAFSEHILRISVDTSAFELAYSFLSTLVGFRLLRATAVGTKLLSMRPDLLRQLPFPDEADLVERCGVHVLAAIDARVAAKQAEEEAVRILEHEVFPEWLS